MKIEKRCLAAFIALSAAGAVAQNTFPATGNVGIGTTNPSDYLTVAGSNTNKVALSISNSSGTPIAGLSILAGGSSGFGINGWADASVIEGESPNGLVLGSINSPGNGIGGPITFQINRSPVAVISTTGNFGIGTSSPGASLEVNGNVKLTSGSGASMTFQDGSVQSVAWNGTLAGADYAESVEVTGDRAKYEPGDVLVIDPGAQRTFQKSTTPYSTNVMGVYSTKPGVLGRSETVDKEHITDEVPMAMVGIVPTKVSAENGPIHPGDMLVSASTSGCAMKGTDRRKMFGAVIGKALGSLETGTGLLEVAVSLQ